MCMSPPGAAVLLQPHVLLLCAFWCACHGMDRAFAGLFALVAVQLHTGIEMQAIGWVLAEFQSDSRAGFVVAQDLSRFYKLNLKFRGCIVSLTLSWQVGELSFLVGQLTHSCSMVEH